MVSAGPPQTCQHCGAPLLTTSRFCPRCGALVAPEALLHEIMIPGGKHLRVGQSTLSLRELRAMIEAGVFWWQQQMESSDQVTRTHAADAIKDLSRILDSLAQQLAQGRETIRITRRLPVMREYSVGCPTCGRGNRAGARFCLWCGTRLLDANSALDPTQGQVRLDVAALSVVGQVREKNEDTCTTETIRSAAGTVAHMLLVADGMGGANAGEVASQLACETVLEGLRTALHTALPADDAAWQTLLRRTITTANERIYTAAKGHAERKGMGTTLTVIAVVENRAHLAHVGDSRAYLCNATGVTAEGEPVMQLSSDHTLVARLVDIGQLTPEEARVHPHRNVLYRALGTEPGIDVDTGSHALRTGDRLVLCSDGLTTHVDDAELVRITLEDAPPTRICERLVALANERGGQDNISVIVAKVEGR